MAMTPTEWRDKLTGDLHLRRPMINRFECYYRGDHPTPWAPKEVRDAYRAFMRMSRSNWCRLVVKATSERLRPTGVQFSDDTEGDVDAWKRYWQGNRLDAECRMVHNAALVARRGFTLVWPRDGNLAPSITPEHPSQVIVEYKPGDRRTRVAGLKTFEDIVARKVYATLWLSDAVYSWVADMGATYTAIDLTGQHSAYYPLIASADTWEPWIDTDQNIAPEATNPLGEVPLIEFVADPMLIGEPLGELDGGVTDIQDRINRTILDRLVTANFSSFPQRWSTGLEIPKDDDGNDIEPFKAAVDRVWINENPDGKFGQFDAGDLSGYIKSTEADIQHLAAITRTPPHYLLGQSGAFPSGDSLESTETGLVAKCEERIDSFTESWEDTLRLALKADKDDRSDDLALSITWKDPKTRSLAEVVDAAVKLDSIGVPWREVMAKIGYTPTEIDRLELERAEDQAEGLLAGPEKVAVSVAATEPGQPAPPAQPATPPPAPVPAA